MLMEYVHMEEVHARTIMSLNVFYTLIVYTRSMCKVAQEKEKLKGVNELVKIKHVHARKDIYKRENIVVEDSATKINLISLKVQL